MKAKQATSNSGICYKYVEIKNTKEWNFTQDKLNNYIRIIKIDVENILSYNGNSYKCRILIGFIVSGKKLTLTGRLNKF